MHQFQFIADQLGERLSTPAPVLLLDVMEENILRMQAFADAHGKALRPHVKTHKSIEIGRRQLAAGATGITAGTLGEVEVYAAAGFGDIFLAYPLIATGTKGDRLRAVADLAEVRLGIENSAAADAVAHAFADAPQRIGLVIEVDSGAGRSGVQPAAAGELARYARDLGLRVDGVFTYPGHGSKPGMREAAAEDQARALGEAVESLAAVGVRAEVVSAGSSPTVAFSTHDVITEVRPGEYVLNDHDNFALGNCAAEEIGFFVATTVVSDQGHAHVIVDAGTKALAREGNYDRGYGQVPEVDGVLTVLNEYHGFLTLPEGGTRPAPGQVLPIVPHHVCPVMNSFDEVILSDRRGRYLGTWSIEARGQLN
ncbi:alanine racemase [Leucobacter rhizosphaerae]|uniref:Alanine racemase n=1 Tax=Leucobacter rhizosphaerae TaxID=2932245 RepID=A0ABY4FSU0_9MICO|nr:alanine racemase [Leucobacter rhizosphaerae]UOQ59317.1 alanine racemase [Leucobacter rhizosphaerae]